MGARYAFVYDSIVEPGKVLVVIGIRTEQPLLNPVSYTHLTLPTMSLVCRSRWSPYH